MTMASWTGEQTSNTSGMAAAWQELGILSSSRPEHTATRAVGLYFHACCLVSVCDVQDSCVCAGECGGTGQEKGEEEG